MIQLIEVKRYLKIKPKVLSILQDQIPQEVTLVTPAPTDVNGSYTSMPHRQDAHPHKAFQQTISKFSVG